MNKIILALLLLTFSTLPLIAQEKKKLRIVKIKINKASPQYIYNMLRGNNNFNLPPETRL